jgi:hypothetical protein
MDLLLERAVTSAAERERKLQRDDEEARGP